MQKTRVFLAALAVTALYSSITAAAPALDAAGKCRDNGKFVAAAMCKTAAPAATKCRDIKTKKFAKCSAAGTEPVPTASAK
jgi:hypothetical protein